MWTQTHRVADVRARARGVYRRRKKGCTVRDPAGPASSDLVNRRFVADRPDALSVTDITQHRTDESWLYCGGIDKRGGQ